MRLVQDTTRKDLWRAYSPDGRVTALGHLEIDAAKKGEASGVVFVAHWTRHEQEDHPERVTVIGRG